MRFWLFFFVLKFNMQGLVSFLIIPNMDFETTDKPKPAGSSMSLDALIHIRALFNYVPQEDIYIPCKEIGLGFNKGDILHIISQVRNQSGLETKLSIKMI